MKVILLNGSPHAQGCTHTALCEVARGLEDNGIGVEHIHIGTDERPGCKGCFACRKTGHCVMDDQVNQIAQKLKQTDGMVLGSSVYFASPCGCIVTARRAGTTAALDPLNKYPLVCEQPLVSSSYWCMVHGNTPQEIRANSEGLEIPHRLGCNMAWMVRAVSSVPPPPPVS